MRFVDDDSIREEYFFCEELSKETAGQEIFRVTNEFFTAHGIDWNNCFIVYIYGASAMVGEGRGFAALVKCQNPAIEITHCCIHREAFIVKVLPMKTSERMNDCIRIVNFIKARALNSRIFALRRNGITTSVNAILHCCALAFTWKSARKTLRTEA